jgi:hypothetical protein
MTPSKSGRGRPKGTGLNDAAQLRAIAGLLAADPDLKPTTAIKQLGISDPSVIRRLRDKFHAVETALIAELNATSPPTGEPALHSPVPAMAMPADVPAARTLNCAAVDANPGAGRVVTLQTGRDAKKSRPVAASGQATAPAKIETLSAVRARRSAAVPLPSETELPMWLGIGLSLYALSVEAQFAVAGSMFQWPPMVAVLQSQVAFSELAIAMTMPVMPAPASAD